MRLQSLLTTFALLGPAALAHAGVLPEDVPAAPPAEAMPALQPAELQAPAPGVGQAVSSAPRLSCDLCTAAEVAGGVGFAVSYGGAVVHMLSIWARPATFYGNPDSGLGTGGIFDAGEMLAVDGAALFELVPIVGPLVGVALDNDPAHQKLLFADCGVQAVSVGAAVAGWTLEKRWGVAVAPVASQQLSGVVVASAF